MTDEIINSTDMPDRQIAAAFDGITEAQAELALDGFDNLQADGRLEKFCGPREQAELIAFFERIRGALGRA